MGGGGKGNEPEDASRKVSGGEVSGPLQLDSCTEKKLSITTKHPRGGGETPLLQWVSFVTFFSLSFSTLPKAGQEHTDFCSSNLLVTDCLHQGVPQTYFLSYGLALDLLGFLGGSGPLEEQGQHNPKRQKECETSSWGLSTPEA